jgi:hypothetical protein
MRSEPREPAMTAGRTRNLEWRPYSVPVARDQTGSLTKRWSHVASTTVAALVAPVVARLCFVVTFRCLDP